MLGFGVVALYSVAMTVVVIFGDEALALRMLNIFPGVLGSVLALATGYLIGQSGGSSTHCECSACEEARFRAGQRASQKGPD